MAPLHLQTQHDLELARKVGCAMLQLLFLLLQLLHQMMDKPQPKPTASRVRKPSEVAVGQSSANKRGTSATSKPAAQPVMKLNTGARFAYADLQTPETVQKLIGKSDAMRRGMLKLLL